MNNDKQASGTPKTDAIALAGIKTLAELSDAYKLLASMLEREQTQLKTLLHEANLYLKSVDSYAPVNAYQRNLAALIERIDFISM